MKMEEGSAWVKTDARKQRMEGLEWLLLLARRVVCL